MAKEKPLEETLDEVREDDGQIYVPRDEVDFDPDEGLLSGTAIDGTSDIPDEPSEANGTKDDSTDESATDSKDESDDRSQDGESEQDSGTQDSGTQDSDTQNE